MNDIVDDTLRHWRRSTFEWGQRDCMLSIGDYIAARTGTDISKYYRGRYDTEAGALAEVEAAGGVAGLVDLTGLRRCLNPGRGDVLAVDTGDATVGALCTGDGAAMRLERGVIVVRLRFVRIVQAWRMPDGETR